MSCSKCYDFAVRVLTGPPKHRRYKIEVRHACADCASEAVIFAAEDGRLMIRCAGCVPDGVACDRCLPPQNRDQGNQAGG